jgi:hypothetical protein
MSLSVPTPPLVRACIRAAVLTVLGGQLACSHNHLDASTGLRNREIFRVQTASRPGRDVPARGEEVEAGIVRYLQALTPQPGSSGGGGSGGGAMQNLGLPSMH